MAFLKKSLFLVLFLGIVSLSVCEEEKREGEEKEEKREEEEGKEENEDGNEEHKEKRFLGAILKIGHALAKTVLPMVTNAFKPKQ
uniref:Figainin 2 n=1 Tax=Boana raniceps TaxID=192750 RepID=FIG02_BOARA|nr:RecName: Full=Figainin 2; AltName: Full=Br22; Flags: Precursor [Boana raniceps]AVG44203.1 figainin-02 precursor [Boana raniceps]